MDERSAAMASALKRAIEGRAGDTLADLYADDAVISIVDRYNTPSKPRELSGRAEIAAYWADICGRDMVHKVGPAVTDGQQLAFTEACSYPDGTKVLCATVMELKDGHIASQTIVQAWDE